MQKQLAFGESEPIEPKPEPVKEEFVLKSVPIPDTPATRKMAGLLAKLEGSFTIMDFNGNDHTILTENPEYARLKAEYDKGGRVFSDLDIWPDKTVDILEEVLAEAQMIAENAEETDNPDMFLLFKRIMDDRYYDTASFLCKVKFDMIAELYGRLLSELDKLESLEDYCPRYFRLFYQAGVIDSVMREG